MAQTGCAAAVAAKTGVDTTAMPANNAKHEIVALSTRI
jgi:hypothetical protein